MSVWPLLWAVMKGQKVHPPLTMRHLRPMASWRSLEFDVAVVDWLAVDFFAVGCIHYIADCSHRHNRLAVVAGTLPAHKHADCTGGILHIPAVGCNIGCTAIVHSLRIVETAVPAEMIEHLAGRNWLLVGSYWIEDC